MVWSGQLTTALVSGADGFGDQIGFLCFQAGQAWNESGVDNLDVVAAPEPGTYALLGGGLLSLLAFRRQSSA